MQAFEHALQAAVAIHGRCGALVIVPRGQEMFGHVQYVSFHVCMVHWMIAYMRRACVQALNAGSR